VAAVTDRSLPQKAPELSKLLEPLVRHGVDFVLIGGMAGIAQGSTYPSYDLDVLYARNRANVSRLVAALREIGVHLRGAPPDLPFVLDERAIENGANFTFITPYGDFDVLADAAGVRSYDDLVQAAEEIEVHGIPVRVASLDDLIAMKRAANRSKDKLMVEEYIVLADVQKQRALKEKEEEEGG
jgi:predicted nucleotidyltransferase